MQDSPDESFELFKEGFKKQLAIVGNQYGFISDELIKRIYLKVSSLDNKKVSEINYGQLIQDLITGTHPETTKAYRDQYPPVLDEEESKAMLKTRRIYITSNFLTYVQDSTISPAEKVEACDNLYNQIKTAKEMYGNDIVEDQAEVMEMILEYRNENQEKVKTIKAYVSNDDLIDLWPYSKEQLISLSTELAKNKFPHDSADFFLLFSTRLMDQPLNWIGGSRACMFLFDRLFPTFRNSPADIINFIVTRITDKGNIKIYKHWGATLKNIESIADIATKRSIRF